MRIVGKFTIDGCRASVRGIGVGTIANGRVMLGATGAAGELGQCRYPGSARLCRCGLIGCVEAMVSGWWGFNSVSATCSVPTSPFPQHWPRWRRYNIPVNDVLDEAAAALGLAVSWLVNLVNPTAVLLGGNEFATGAMRFFTVFRNAVLEQTALTNREWPQHRIRQRECRPLWRLSGRATTPTSYHSATAAVTALSTRSPRGDGRSRAGDGLCHAVRRRGRLSVPH